MIYMEKIEQLMDREEFVQKLNMTDSVEDIQRLLAEYGIEIPLDELNKMVASASVGIAGELDEAALDNVAGGGLIKKFLDWLCNRNTKGINDVVDIACGKKKK